MAEDLKTVSVYLTPQDKAEIAAEAKRLGMRLSGFLRWAALKVARSE